MIAGARQGTLSALRRLVSFSMSQDLGVYVVPGVEIARAHGLDIEAAGMNIVASPRHACVLLIVGDIPSTLCDAAAVIYAQMPRPRIIFSLTTSELSPLPAPDIVAELSQQHLIKGIAKLRKVFANEAFHTDVSDFDAPVLQIRIEYVCPMHPEVIQDEPGSCPKCGMDLMPREVQANTVHSHTEHNMASDEHSEMLYTCPMHPEVVQSEPGSCPECGMNLEPREVEAKHDHHNDHTTVEYTCPMHPEVVQSEPGSCPECGMNLEPREVEAKHDDHSDHADIEYTCPMHPEVVQDEPGSCPKCGMFLEARERQATQHKHTAMDSHMEHGDSGFMSMIDVTKDLPRSGDGLQMEWIDVPFGPFFPGLPSGLLLTFTLDGDTVAASTAVTLVGSESLLCHAISAQDFTERLAGLNPLAPVSYQILACLAIEQAVGIDIDTNTAKIRLAALERERIVSHLSWLALFAQQTGFDWLIDRASSLQKLFMQADIKQIIKLKKEVLALAARLQRTPLLRSRTKGMGKLFVDTDMTLSGPVARASGLPTDARSENKIYTELGFTVITESDGDTYARFQLRLHEIKQSIELIENEYISDNLETDIIRVLSVNNIDNVSGEGQAVIETPRGQARIQLTLDKGLVTTAKLETPSTQHLAFIEQLTDQQELGDALLAVGSLDLSPWEIQQ